MEKIVRGTLIGALCGIIDCVPMIAMGLPLDSEISAFLFWVASGFLVSTSSLKLLGWQKGLVVSFVVLAPCAVLIGWANPSNLIPIIIMTSILGSALGHFASK